MCQLLGRGQGSTGRWLPRYGLSTGNELGHVPIVRSGPRIYWQMNPQIRVEHCHRTGTGANYKVGPKDLHTAESPGTGWALPPNWDMCQLLGRAKGSTGRWIPRYGLSTANELGHVPIARSGPRIYWLMNSIVQVEHPLRTLCSSCQGVGWTKRFICRWIPRCRLSPLCCNGSEPKVMLNPKVYWQMVTR